jgi:hypothetical protein
MNDYRDCAWPSKARIAKHCGLGVRAVQINMAKICESGYLLNNGSSNLGTIRYDICTPALNAPPHIDTSTPASDAPELNKELTNTTTTRKTKFVRPSLEQLQAHAKAKGFIIDCTYFHEFYETANWLDAGGKPVKNWKLKLLTWNKREIKNGFRNSAGTNNKQHRPRQTVADRLREQLAKDIANGTAV